jgi:hypothetical protein
VPGWGASLLEQEKRIRLAERSAKTAVLRFAIADMGMCLRAKSISQYGDDCKSGRAGRAGAADIVDLAYIVYMES